MQQQHWFEGGLGKEARFAAFRGDCQALKMLSAGSLMMLLVERSCVCFGRARLFVNLSSSRCALGAAGETRDIDRWMIYPAYNLSFFWTI